MDINLIIDWLVVRHRYVQEGSRKKWLNRTKLMNLLYYVQGASLGMYQRKAFDNSIIVQPNGVQIKAVDEQLDYDNKLESQLSYTEIKRYSDVQENPFLHHVLNVVDNAYGNYSSSDLSKKIQHEEPWQKTSFNHEIDIKLLKNNFVAKIIE